MSVGLMVTPPKPKTLWIWATIFRRSTLYERKNEKEKVFQEGPPGHQMVPLTLALGAPLVLEAPLALYLVPHLAQGAPMVLKQASLLLL